jgi:glycosyltransferase involved in cell wall biosynthesis/SAM-dependent methyltransferase
VNEMSPIAPVLPPAPEPVRLTTGDKSQHRLLIFIVAYNAESTISSVLSRIPAEICEQYETEVLVIDDASTDRTFERGHEHRRTGESPFKLTVLFNPVNQGYGGNQKIGYFYAIKHGFDFVALVHGDGQYAPECLPDLVRPLQDGTADAVFGSRMMTSGGALGGGMPYYKFFGNKILSWFENWMLGSAFTEFHSGYRIYSVAALKRVPFDLNTQDFHFDTEIIVQFVLAGLRIVELPIPTYYGDEICHVNGLKYAFDVVTAVVKARAQALGIFYDRRFDCAKDGQGNGQYELKLDYDSPHRFALETISSAARVIDLGCAGGYMGAVLKAERQCRVTGVDCVELPPGVELDEFRRADLNGELPALPWQDCDYILLLDVIEHLVAPEQFVDRLRRQLALRPDATLVVSTGNVGFFITRLMLLLGQFNYGKRGILDMTHTRLFTFATVRRLFEQGGFRVIETRGVPGPFPLALGRTWLARVMVELNNLLIRLSRGLFSYQIYMVLKPNASLQYLLHEAEVKSAIRAPDPISPIIISRP